MKKLTTTAVLKMNAKKKLSLHLKISRDIMDEFILEYGTQPSDMIDIEIEVEK